MNYKYKSLNGLQNAVFAEQERLIEEKYGKQAAEKANYGYGQGGDDFSVSIATKVYGHGVITTDASIGDSKKDFYHNWSK